MLKWVTGWASWDAGNMIDSVPGGRYGFISMPSRLSPFLIKIFVIKYTVKIIKQSEFEGCLFNRFL